MAYQETADLGCEKTFSLGGVRTDKKTNKKYNNPKEAEGYFLGTKSGIDTGNDKPANLHIFEGEVKNTKGEVIYTGRFGIWGKTDLDRKAAQWKVGLMTKAVFSGMQDPAEVKRGRKPMYLYKGFQDPDNTNGAVEASGEEVFEEEAGDPVEAEAVSGGEEEAYEEEAALEDEEAPVDEPAPTPTKKAAKAETPSADRQKAMQKLLDTKPSSKTA